MPLEDFVYTILEFICAFASLSLMIILQTSKEKYFHNNFFCIFKVTAAYGVINLLTSVGYRICSTNLVLYIIRNIVSARKLYLIFVGQFLFFAIVMSPWLFIQLDWIDECINYIRRPHRGNILILASAYCSYCIFSAFLTTLTIRQLRKKRTNMKRIMNTSQLILVRYAIYCSFAHFLKGAILLARVTTYFMDTSEEFLSELTITLFYPINIFTISFTSFLLVILSHNVRSKLKKNVMNYDEFIIMEGSLLLKEESYRNFNHIEDRKQE
uniref:G protein-coupled receptor n=1 Tax=Pristionchus pacificus TaxID=54126 RepID=A0A8R1YQL0_PRIPA